MSRRYIALLMLCGVCFVLLVSLAAGQESRSSPYRIAFEDWSFQGEFGHVTLIDPDGTNRQVLPFNEGVNTSVTCSPDGEYLAFIGGKGIHYVAADLVTPHYLGTGISPWDGISIANNVDKFAYVKDFGTANTEIYVSNKVVDPFKIVRVTEHPGSDEMPSLSPDGSQLVFFSNRDVTKNDRELYMVNTDGTELRRLNHDGGFNVDPAWSPDGLRIVYSSCTDMNRNMYTLDIDGSNKTRLTDFSGESGAWGPDWSPDGSMTAFSADLETDGVYEIYTMNTDGSNITKITDDHGYNANPCWLVNPDFQPEATEAPES